MPSPPGSVWSLVATHALPGSPCTLPSIESPVAVRAHLGSPSPPLLVQALHSSLRAPGFAVLTITPLVNRRSSSVLPGSPSPPLAVPSPRDSSHFPEFARPPRPSMQAPVAVRARTPRFAVFAVSHLVTSQHFVHLRVRRPHCHLVTHSSLRTGSPFLLSNPSPAAVCPYLPLLSCHPFCHR